MHDHNIHLIKLGPRWAVKEGDKDEYVMVNDSREEALKYAARIAKEKHWQLIVHDTVEENLRNPVTFADTSPSGMDE